MTDIKLKGGTINLNGYGCNGGACYSYSARGFLTKEEKLEMLKDYKESLDKESKGVAERINELQDE